MTVSRVLLHFICQRQIATVSKTPTLGHRVLLIKKAKDSQNEMNGETLSLLVTDHLFKAIDAREVTAMVIIDLSKAFDSINPANPVKKASVPRNINECSKLVSKLPYQRE